MIRHASFFVMVICGATLTGCTKGLTVPSAGEFDRIVILGGTGHAERSIEDAGVKEKLVAFLNSLGDGWRKPWGTYPSPRYTIALGGSSDISGELRVDLAEDWIGERQQWVHSGKRRLRALSVSERAEVWSILNLAVP